MSEIESTTCGVSGTLTIFVHRAKELINVKKLDKQSPFVILRVGHMTCRSKVCFRGGQKPEWSFLAKFQITPEIKPVLDIDCFHETKKAPKFIGKVKLNFKTALYANEDDGDDKWVELQNGVEYAGKVYLEMSFKLGDSNEAEMMGADQFGNSFTTNGYANTLDRFGEKGILDDIQSINLENPEGRAANVSVGVMKNNRANYQHGVITSEPEINDYLTSKNTYNTNQRSNVGSAQTSYNSRHKNQTITSADMPDNIYDYEASKNTMSYGFNSNIKEHTSPSATADNYSSEPLFAKLKELKGKMFNFKNGQSNNNAINNGINDDNNDHEEYNKMNDYNRNFLSNSKSSKNSQLSKEQMNFQILEKAIAGDGLNFESSVNSEAFDHFNINDDIPPLPSAKIIEGNQMGGRIESARLFSKSRVPSQPMKPIFNMSRRPPPPS
ncbi:Ingression protein 1 [Hanseniaspora uvarum DSM 2768]|nr:Ingression protein 1 [Hanseniaspora uvarum DSM 2768]GMM42286.1 Inn1 protein [Hanseniaspora uvarum]